MIQESVKLFPEIYVSWKTNFPISVKSVMYIYTFKELYKHITIVIFKLTYICKYAFFFRILGYFTNVTQLRIFTDVRC